MENNHEKVQVPESTSSTKSEVLKKFTLGNFQKPTTEAHQPRKNEKADFSVVNTPNNGKRIKLSKELCEKLGLYNVDEGYVDIAFSPEGVAISKNLSGVGTTFPLSKGGHIYSKDLVDEVTEKFDLNFDGVTTRSFSNPQYHELESGEVVVTIEI